MFHWLEELQMHPAFISKLLRPSRPLCRPVTTVRAVQDHKGKGHLLGCRLL